MSWKVIGNALRSSVGMLSGPGALPFTRFLRLLL